VNAEQILVMLEKAAAPVSMWHAYVEIVLGTRHNEIRPDFVYVTNVNDGACQLTKTEVVGVRLNFLTSKHIRGLVERIAALKGLLKKARRSTA
jgi:hypothetical protein